jgi:DNA-binding FrmR family transcriptional regulator
MGNIVDNAPRPAKLAGFKDESLNPAVHEALKVLADAKAAYVKALANIEGQYLHALECAHDGRSAACNAVKAQVAAVRKLF